MEVAIGFDVADDGDEGLGVDQLFKRHVVKLQLAGDRDHHAVVALLDEGSDAHLAHLAERYALGIAEYPDHPEVVAGFLMPVLVGQVEPDRPRLTWEAPAAWWAKALRDAGFAGVAVEPLVDYWWAPAVLVTGSR